MDFHQFSFTRTDSLPKTQDPPSASQPPPPHPAPSPLEPSPRSILSWSRAPPAGVFPDVLTARLLVERLTEMALASDLCLRREMCEDLLGELEGVLEGARRHSPGASGEVELFSLEAMVRRLCLLAVCPDIRGMMSSLLRKMDLKVPTPLELRPSRFEPAAAFPPLDEVVRPGLATVEWGAGLRVGHLDWVLGVQPEFRRVVSEGLERLLNTESPLPRPWRSFLAIQAASRHYCEYLVRLYQEDFLFHGGDSLWLSDPETVPSKLRALEKIGAILAHQPWVLTRNHIQTLHTEHRWSSSDLAHAMCIMSTFHSLPSFTYGVGLQLEADRMSHQDYLEMSELIPHVGSDPAPDLLCGKSGLPESCVVQEGGVWDAATPRPACYAAVGQEETLLGLLSIADLEREKEGQPTDGGYVNRPFVAREVDTPHPPSHEGKEKMGTEERDALARIMATTPSWRAPSSLRFRHTELGHVDFDQKKNDRLSADHFSWSDHALLMLQTLAPSLADMIDEEQRFCVEFTNDRIGDVKVQSTTPVRQAILLYVRRMYGVWHDDYDYAMTNKYLTLTNKVFIKKLSCYPERVCAADYWRIRSFDKMSLGDMVHYAVICYQAFRSLARRVVELMYAMRALASYQATVQGSPGGVEGGGEESG